MASIYKYLPILIEFEGGPTVTNYKNDKGGLTKYGITLNTWLSQGYDKDGDNDVDADDLLLVDEDDFAFIVEKRWNMWKADKIENQSIANLVVDWLYNSGYWGIKIPQRVLGLNDDGIVGPKTIEAINAEDSEDIFNRIWKARESFIINIVEKDPSQKVFLNGWLNRLNKLKFYT